MPDDFSDQQYALLKRVLGYRPHPLDIYLQALRHKSLYDHPNENYERLEFLGDSVLSMAISNVLFKKFPSAEEGTMTIYRSRIVSRKKLHSIAIKMRIDKLVIAQVQRPLKETSIIGNALEALLGAIYVTKGYRFTEKFIENKIIGPYIDLNRPEKLDEDFKSRLIEQCQAEQKKVDFITEQQKDEIQPSFRCTIRIDHKDLASGTGKSKKKAEQKAARKALKYWHNR